MVTALHRLAKVASGEKRGQGSRLSQQLQKKLSQAMVLEQSQEQVSIRTWSNTAWAMAKLQLQDVKIFELAEKTLASKLDEVRPQELANILWSLGATSLGNNLDLKRYVVHLLHHEHEFEAQHLSNIAKNSVFAHRGLLKVLLYIGSMPRRCLAPGQRDRNVHGFCSTSLLGASTGILSLDRISQHRPRLLPWPSVKKTFARPCRIVHINADSCTVTSGALGTGSQSKEGSKGLLSDH
eukprot:symbB.v1.2.000991.t1/scaffold43.1/size391093/20